MNRRTFHQTIAANVASAMCAAGEDTHSVAKATDMQVPDLESRLHGETDFTIGELLHVGGFLHVPAHLLMREVSA